MDDQESVFSDETYWYTEEDEGNNGVIEEYPGYESKTAAYLVFDHSSASIPQIPKQRKEMDINDVAKESILPRLPAKSLARFRSVSKEWNLWIKHPFLAHVQSYLFKDLSGFFSQNDGRDPRFLSLNNCAYGVPTPSLRFLFEPVNIISSSGGLLLCKGYNGSYCVCNPATEEWKDLPWPGYYHGPESDAVLAFEPSVLNMEAHYLVISAATLLDLPFVSFEIYSSETKSWRTSGAFHMGHLGFAGKGIYIKGVAYWVTSTSQVLAFDVKSEIHEIIPLPDECPWDGVLAHIHDELRYIGVSQLSANEYSIKIFGGVKLTLRWSIDLNLGSSPSNQTEGYRVLPCVDGETIMILVGSQVYSYSLSDQKARVAIRGVDHRHAAAKYLPYVNSLVRVA